MSEYFEHIELESGIHHIIWLNNSKESANAYHSLLDGLLKELPSTEISTICILHDYRQVSFHPFLQVLGSVKWLSSLYPHVVARIAYIIRDLSIEILMNNMAQVSHEQIERKLFKPNEEQEAIIWLLNDD
jgi:hypothetical protein